MRRVAAGLAAVVALTGCGGNDAASGSAPTTTAPTTTPTTTVRTPTPTTTVRTTTTAPTTTVRTTAPVTTAAPRATGSLAGRVIVVDPGHNGGNAAHPAVIGRQVDAGGFQKDCNTTGTAGGGYTEATFNWETALVLRADLEAAGATVIMTRDSNTGVGPCIDERGQIAARARADLLVSIHGDGAPASGHGFHVITPTVVHGYTDATAGPSARLAGFVRDQLVAGGLHVSTYVGSNGINPRGDLGTLNRAGVPAVIVECGNMANAADLALMRSDAGHRAIAADLARGVAAFLG